MASLKEKSKSILSEKQLNLLPENIKKDITIFGVTGTYEGSAGVKLFETIEDMNNDETAKEGDLAIVYRNEIQDMKVDTQTQYITFPETVTLPEVFTSSLYLRLRAIDASIMFDGNIQLDQTSFRFDGFSESGMIRVSYSSDDGITYTRDEFMNESGSLSNPVDLGTLVQVETEMGEWNNSLGYFMLVVAPLFDGLFENKQYIDKNEVYQYDISTISYSNSKLNIQQSESKIISYNMLKPIIDKIDNSSYVVFDFCYIGDYWYVFPYYRKGAGYTLCYYDYTNNKLYYTLTSKSDPNNYVDSDAKIYKISKDLSSIEVILQSSLKEPILIWGANPVTYNKITEIPLSSESFVIRYYGTEPNHLADYLRIWCGDGINNGQNISEVSQAQTFNYEYIKKFKYMSAATQFTALPENIYNAVAYGKNGSIMGTLQNISELSKEQINLRIHIWNKFGKDNVILAPEDCSEMMADSIVNTIPLIDTNSTTNMYRMFIRSFELETIPLINTGNVTNMASMFSECSKLNNVPLLNTSNVTDMNYMFNHCRKLETIPKFDTSKVTNASYMFNYCQALQTIPELDTSSVTNMRGMFYACTELKTIPLLDTSSVTNMLYLVSSTNKLSDDSLNNILQMCTNAINVTEKKTLKDIGVNQTLATKCTTLGNYQAFIEAGWTTGY